MALGGKVYDAVDVFVLHQLIDTVEVADVHLDEAVVRLVLDVLQVSEVAGVGQLVEVDDLVFRIFVDEEADDVVADEACASSDDDGSFRTHSICFFEHGFIGFARKFFAKNPFYLCQSVFIIILFRVYCL